jgi:putative acetyltransferase
MEHCNGTVIRPEAPTDVDAIRAINIAAFAHHPYSRQTEHLAVDALRAEGALSVSLVAVREDRLVGHIAFSRTAVGASTGEWYLLGPVAVLPGFQHQGIGAMLVRAGLDALRARRAAGCVLVGERAYYRRFGFDRHPGLKQEGVPDDVVLGIAFGDQAPCGDIRPHEAFAVPP